MRFCLPLLPVRSALLLGALAHSVAMADAQPNKADLALLDTLRCEWNWARLHIERGTSSAGQRTLTEVRCVNLAEAHSHGVSKTRIPPCIGEEPSTLKVMLTTGALGMIEAAIPGLKLARIAKAGSSGTRILEYVETGVRHGSVHWAGDFIARHFPQQTVARCVSVHVGTPWPDERLRFLSARAYVKDLRGGRWQACPTRSGEVCPSGDAAWVRVPAADSQMFTAYDRLPDELSDFEKQLANTDVLGLWTPLVLNWSKNQARVAALVRNRQFFDLFGYPGVQEVWKIRCHHFSDEFREFVGRELAGKELKPLYAFDEGTHV